MTSAKTFQNSTIITFGVLGNALSLMVFLSPLPKLYKIFKNKSTEGFRSVSFVVGLLTAMLSLYYALVKPNSLLLITMNSMGCFVYSCYVCFYLVYATKNDVIECSMLMVLMIVVFGLIFCLTQFLSHGATRIDIVGWISFAVTICGFAAPVNAIREVIKTKEVEFVFILQSLVFTLNSVPWFFYDLLQDDYNIMVLQIPHLVGFIIGAIQIIIYFIYKNKKPVRDGNEEATNNIVVEPHLV